MLLASIQGLFVRKSTKQEVEPLVAKAKDGNEEVLNDLLHSYKPFMKKTASFVCKRYVKEQDDEFSVALSAFYDAIQHFDPNKNASFLTFAHLLIRRKLIDYIRKEARRKEFALGQDSSRYEDEEDAFTSLESSHSFEQFTAEQQAVERRTQIVAYEELLQPFGLTFKELANVSPSHEDTRQTAIQIAQIIADSDDFYETFLIKKRLPIKELEELVSVSRKTIERQRKYIIAIVILLKSDLHYLKEYLKGRMS